MAPSTLHKPFTAPKIALVLSSGGIKGIAHIGVLEVLDQAGIVPDVIVGCSAGAIVGALYAAKKDITHTKKVILNIAPYSRSYRFFGLPSLYKGVVKGEGYFSMEKMSNYLTETLQVATFAELKIPLAVVATNINKASLTTFSSGPLVSAVCASAAIPGIFQPVHIQDQYYVDGYVISPLPVHIATKLGAKLIIAVSVIEPIKDADISQISSVLFRSFKIANRHRIQNAIKQADFLIDAEIKDTGYLFTSHKGVIKLYEAGRKAAEKMLKQIKARVEALE